MVDTCQECFLCGREIKRGFYNHLFYHHGYTKGQCDRLKQARVEMKRRGDPEDNHSIFRCEHCDRSFSLRNSFVWHRQRCSKSFELGIDEKESVRCPKCGDTVRDLKELVKHCSTTHGASEDYNIGKISFESETEFEEWMKSAQEASVTSFVVHSRKTIGDLTRVYYRCHRSGPSTLPHASTTTSKRVVSHCTAFVNARILGATSHVDIEYCLAHIGHELDPSCLWLDKYSEQLIVELLKEGFTYGQVKRKIREKFRSANGFTGKENRLFFVTSGDIRAIAKRNHLFPGRRDLDDLISLEKRINENNINDGIRYYAPIINETGDGSSLVIINETQRKWLSEFSHRGIGIDDTFNVSMYKLRLATVIIADHCDVLFQPLSCSVSDIVTRRVHGEDYGDTLTFLLNEGEHDLVDYMHQNWTHRIEEWAAHHRRGAVMNTSMMCERWHKHLKREVFCSKSKIRIDELVDALITTVKEMEEDSTVIEHRGLLEGRWRLQNNHLNHTKAVNTYERSRDLIEVVGPGLWEVRSRKSNNCYIVEEESCPCSKTLNHCQKTGCSACPYSFSCECDEDRKAGISCKHIHAVVLYAPQGRIPNTEAVVAPDASVNSSEPLDSTHELRSTSSMQRTGVSSQDRLDVNNELLQQIEMEYAGLHSTLRRMASQPNEDAEESLKEALAFMKQSHSISKRRLATVAPVSRKGYAIAPRPELPLRGPVPADAKPIRMKTTSAINKGKRKAHIATPKDFVFNEVRVCGYCFRESPLNDASDVVYWIKCSICDTWGHMNSCVTVGAQCNVCNAGTMRYSEC